MNFKFENQGNNTFLVYVADANANLDSVTLGMITNNDVPGLAHVTYSQIDSDKYLKYNITAKIPMRHFFDVTVSKEKLMRVFNGICETMINSEDYMVDINTIVLDMDYIFVEVTNYKVSLISVPVDAVYEKAANAKTFFKDIMFNTKFDQNENCDYVAKILNYLNSTDVFSYLDFKSFLNTIDSISVNAPQNAGNNSAIFNNTANNQLNNSYVPAGQVMNNKQAVLSPNNNVGTVFNNSTASNNNMKAGVQQTSNNAGKTNNAVNDSDNKKKKGLFGSIFSSDSKKEKNSKANSVNTGFAVPGQNQSITAQNKQSVNVPQNVPEKASPKKPVKGSPKQPVDIPQNKPINSRPVQMTVPQPINQSLYKELNTPSGSNMTQAKMVQQSAVVQQSVPMQQSVPGQQSIPVQQAQQQYANYNTNSQVQSMNYGETTVLNIGDIGETTVLNAASQIKIPYLIRLKNNEKIAINKPVFRIGKERSYVDYFIGDNTAISRSHANIIYRDGKYYIVDTNSTNHTFINGQMIQSNCEVVIEHGVKIRMADEDFMFNVY